MVYLVEGLGRQRPENGCGGLIEQGDRLQHGDLAGREGR